MYHYDHYPPPLLKISLALYLLWGTLGPSTLAGLAVMLLLMPLNGFIAAKMRKFQIQQMKFKDQRIKLMTEVLNGMQVGGIRKEIMIS